MTRPSGKTYETTIRGRVERNLTCIIYVNVSLFYILVDHVIPVQILETGEDAFRDVPEKVYVDLDVLIGKQGKTIWTYNKNDLIVIFGISEDSLTVNEFLQEIDDHFVFVRLVFQAVIVG